MASQVEQLDTLASKCRDLKSEIAKIIVGQEEVVNQLLISIFSGGHCLLVGVPGLAKTLLVNTIAQSLGLSFNRIQFTPDLMPSDITGSEILNKDRAFEFVEGPVFANIVLADEINRTPPKTQAALLEAMQEHNVTAAGRVHALPNPFFVLATQNPIEQEGTYPLPEAQLDRFMFMLWLDYPSFAEEVEILKRTTTAKQEQVRQILTAEDILAIQSLIKDIPVSDNVYQYAVRLVSKTRLNKSDNTTAKQYLLGSRSESFTIPYHRCKVSCRTKRKILSRHRRRKRRGSIGIATQNSIELRSTSRRTYL